MSVRAWVCESVRKWVTPCHTMPYMKTYIQREPLMHMPKAHVRNARADCSKQLVTWSRDQRNFVPRKCISSASRSTRTGGIFKYRFMRVLEDYRSRELSECSYERSCQLEVSKIAILKHKSRHDLYWLDSVYSFIFSQYLKGPHRGRHIRVEVTVQLAKNVGTINGVKNKSAEVSTTNLGNIWMTRG